MLSRTLLSESLCMLLVYKMIRIIIYVLTYIDVNSVVLFMGYVMRIYLNENFKNEENRPKNNLKSKFINVQK